MSVSALLLSHLRSSLLTYLIFTNSHLGRSYNEIIHFHTYYYHHPTKYIPLIEKLWTGPRKGRTAATHTYKGEHDSPRSRKIRRRGYMEKIN